MPAPNAATITTSLERSLQNCSLNHQRNGGEANGLGKSSSSDENDHLLPDGDSDITVELNSHLSLPFDWEQCLDLKTGEIYYINWKNGMKTKEDPRTAAATLEYSGDFYSEDDDDSSFESEESSAESCISYSGGDEGQHYEDRRRVELVKEKENVLVVGGCKSCFMYFMVPKRDEHCPKCSGLLLRFDRPVNGSP